MTNKNEHYALLELPYYVRGGDNTRQNCTFVIFGMYMFVKSIDSILLSVACKPSNINLQA